MPIHKYFVKENARKAEIDEFLAEELKRAGYSRVETTKTPLGTRVVIYAAKPGLVIGRRGQSIRDLTKLLEEKFGVENPQISVATLESPELDPKVVAAQIAQALQRGIHFRRAAYWAVQRVTEAGALGVEIAIRGKLTTDRARYEKYRAGYLPFVGETIVRQLRTANIDIQLKQGLFGISVKLLPPNVDFPDKPVIRGIAEKPVLPKPEVVEEVLAEPVEAVKAAEEPVPPVTDELIEPAEPAEAGEMAETELPPEEAKEGQEEAEEEADEEAEEEQEDEAESEAGVAKVADTKKT